MNINVFYKSLFEDILGLDVMGLESRFQDLVELINRNSLYTFSDCIPCKYTTVINPFDPRFLLRREKSHYGRYCYIKDAVIERFNLPIFDIIDCNYADTARSGYYGEIVGANQINDFESIMIGAEQAYATLMSDSAIPFKPNYQYEGGNIVYLRNVPENTPVELVLRVPYPNIASIPDSYMETFRTLAEFDVKIKLWNELKYLEDIVTPAGNLNLKVSDWENAKQERADWLRQFRIDSGPDRYGEMYYTIL